MSSSLPKSSFDQPTKPRTGRRINIPTWCMCLCVKCVFEYQRPECASWGAKEEFEEVYVKKTIYGGHGLVGAKYVPYVRKGPLSWKVHILLVVNICQKGSMQS